MTREDYLKNLTPEERKQIEEYKKQNEATTADNKVIQNLNATLTAVRPTGRFGELDLSGDKITSFREKPETESGYVNGGFFVVNKKIALYLAGDDCVFEFDALPKLAGDGKLNAFRHDGYWQCMDNLREVEVLNKLWDQGTPPWKVW